MHNCLTFIFFCKTGRALDSRKRHFFALPSIADIFSAGQKQEVSATTIQGQDNIMKITFFINYASIN